MTKTVLFVDDEPSIRGIYEMLGPFLGSEYCVKTASSGREAISLVQKQAFDVVVSDLLMPEISGAELLGKVAQLSPSTARVVVSGFADEITVAKCLLAGHRYFTKPFNPIALTSAIQSLNDAREGVETEKLRDVVGKLEALPTPSETYLQLMKALNAQDRPMAEIAGIVERDPSLAAKVLQAVNSAMFGAGRRVTSLSEALQLIGLHVLRALVLTIQVFDFYQNPTLKAELQRVWAHSANVARRAKNFALEQRWPGEVCEEAFLAGLLHDIGKIILGSTPELERKTLFPEYDLCGGGENAAFSAKLEAEAGAYLLSLWGIPDGIVEAVRKYRGCSIESVREPSAAMALAIAHDLETGTAPRPRDESRASKTILIASANTEVSSVLSLQCRKAQCFHMLATSSTEALQTFHDLQFDLALVDVALFAIPRQEIETRFRQMNGTAAVLVLNREETDPHSTTMRELMGRLKN